uniref:Uncharacterized protein n=1 Tax=Arundo donax TaxID=35708 RepID=A0A0A9A350_ARUDO
MVCTLRSQLFEFCKHVFFISMKRSVASWKFLDNELVLVGIRG